MMSISNVADTILIADTMSTVNTASSIAVATSNGPNSLLLRLPAELQTMIWGYVIATCCPTVAPATPWKMRLSVQHVQSLDDKNGVYPPHPLVYVCKSISKQVQKQIYQTVLFTISYDIRVLRRCTFPPIMRLSLTVGQAAWMLKAIMPFVSNGSKQPKKELTLTNTPRLKFLELRWSITFIGQNSGDAFTGRIERMLTRLHFFRRSFEVNIKLVARHLHDHQAFCTGVITDESTTLRYADGFERDMDFEQSLARARCTGQSQEQQERLDAVVGYISYRSPGTPEYLSGHAGTESMDRGRLSRYVLRFDE